MDVAGAVAWAGGRIGTWYSGGLVRDRCNGRVVEFCEADVPVVWWNGASSGVVVKRRRSAHARCDALNAVPSITVDCAVRTSVEPGRHSTVKNERFQCQQLRPVSVSEIG